MSSFPERMIGAAKLDVSTYEEVESDESSLGQAMGVVVLSSIAAGIGSYNQTAGVFAILIATVAALVGWFLWAFLTYIIGTKILPQEQTSANYGELLRTIGFSSSPGILRIIAFIPAIGPIVSLVAAIWMLVAMVVAVRQALDYTSTLRAVGVCVIGWITYIIIFAILYAMLPGLTGFAS
jgi:hypothetical protein